MSNRYVWSKSETKYVFSSIPYAGGWIDSISGIIDDSSGTLYVDMYDAINIDAATGEISGTPIANQNIHLANGAGLQYLHPTLGNYFSPRVEVNGIT